jgi:hypothetical protein
MSQFYCHFTSKVLSTTAGATVRDQDYYFLGSSVYENADIATRTGIKNIKREDWDKSNVLTPVANIVRAGLIERMVATVETTSTGGKKVYKTYDILVDAEKALDVKSGGDAKELTGLDFKIRKPDGTTKTIGKIRTVGKRTQAVKG